MGDKRMVFRVTSQKEGKTTKNSDFINQDRQFFVNLHENQQNLWSFLVCAGPCIPYYIP